MRRNDPPKHARDDLPDANGGPQDEDSETAFPEKAARVDDAANANEVQVSETEDLRVRLQRARADYDNLQKRVARDADLERERQKARILESFLPVLEYAQYARAEAAKTPGLLADGIVMVVREFERVLAQQNLEGYGAVGELFDATLHEAVEQDEESVLPAGTITRVVQTGYRIGGRILRHAKVAVASQLSSSDS